MAPLHSRGVFGSNDNTNTASVAVPVFVTVFALVALFSIGRTIFVAHHRASVQAARWPARPQPEATPGTAPWPARPGTGNTQSEVQQTVVLQVRNIRWLSRS